MANAQHEPMAASPADPGIHEPVAAHPADCGTHELVAADANIAYEPERIDPWAKDYSYFMAPQEEVDYIRSILTYDDFQHELKKKTEASSDKKKISKILATLDGPLGRYRSLSEAVRAVSHDYQPAQSAIWGGMLVALTWSFRKIDYLKLIVDMLGRMAEAMPQFELASDKLGKQAALGDVSNARAFKSLNEAVRLIWLEVSDFTHSTAMTLWMKFGFSSAMPMGGVSRKLLQTMTMPFFKKTLAEDFARNLERVQREAREFTTVAQKQ